MIRIGRRTVIGGLGVALVAPARSMAADAPLVAAMARLPAQASAFRGEVPAVDLASGVMGGSPVTNASLVPWASAVKPTTCAAVMKLVEKRRIGLDDPVTKFIPEFAAAGKDDILIWHLLTHSAQLGGYDGPLALPPFAEVIARIAAAPRVRARGTAGPASDVPPPGTVAAYNPAGIWILGEILQRVHGDMFWRIMRREIYEPCGMVDSWNGMPNSIADGYGSRLAALSAGPLAFRPGSAPMPGAVPRPSRSTTLLAIASNPAGGGVGPTHDLARFYAMLLGGGTIGGTRILAPETVALMTRERLSDGGVWTWGLGLNLNAHPSAAGERGTSRFGTLASTAAFGHAGASGITAFADPSVGIAIAAIPAAPLIDLLYQQTARIGR